MPNVHKPMNYGGWDLKYPVLATIKYDGNLMYAFVTKDKVVFKTSGFKEIEYVDSPFHGAPEGVYFFEAHSGLGKLGERQNIGFLTTHRTNTAKKIPNGRMIYGIKIFDYVHWDEWENYISHRPYITRMTTVNNAFLKSQIPMSLRLESKDELDALMEFVKDHDWEGLVLRDYTMGWRGDGKRTKECVKVKAVYTYDLRVVKEHNGQGRLFDTMGALSLADASGRVVCKVGTGFSDEERSKSYLGKVVEVKCERISQDGQLIHPVFVCVREEKELDLIKETK